MEGSGSDKDPEKSARLEDMTLCGSEWGMWEIVIHTYNLTPWVGNEPV